MSTPKSFDKIWNLISIIIMFFLEVYFQQKVLKEILATVGTIEGNVKKLKNLIEVNKTASNFCDDCNKSFAKQPIIKKQK